MTTPLNTDGQLETLVRDLTSVVPMSKSGARSRILAWHKRKCLEAEFEIRTDQIMLDELAYTTELSDVDESLIMSIREELLSELRSKLNNKENTNA